MLSALVSTALRLRWLVLAAAAALLVWGTRLPERAAFDVFPEFSLPKVEIQTEGPGLSTEEVEALITSPIENALIGTPELATLRSKSVQGLSSVVLLFEERTDLLRARQLVAERLAGAAPTLPAVAHAPVILQPLSSTSRAMKIAMWSETLSALELSDVARWVVRPQLMSIKGVANVAIWGQRDRELQVLADPERLAASGVTLAALERAARAAVPQDSGGFIDTPNQRLALRHVPAVEDPRRPGAGPDSRHDAAHRRRGGSSRGARSSDRRCDRGGWQLPGSRAAADRREAHRRQYAPDLAGRRGRHGAAAAGPGRNRVRYHGLQTRHLHRALARQPVPRAAHRLRAGGPGADRVPLRMARGPDQHDRHPALARRRCRRPACARGDDQHDGPGRTGDRRRGGGRRCDHRRREHRAAPAAEPRAGRAAVRPSGWFSALRWRCAAPWSTRA